MKIGRKYVNWGRYEDFPSLTSVKANVTLGSWGQVSLGTGAWVGKR